MTASPSAGKPVSLDVTIRHEPFMPTVMLSWDGQSEELEHAPAITWFSAHGAKDLKAVNEAICHAINFGTAVFTIKEAVEPAYDNGPAAPRI